MAGKVITLPDAGDIINRLMTVDDDAYMAARFYPMVAKEAGRELVAQGVVMLLTLKIHDFAESYPSIIGILLHHNVPRYIDALVDDKEVAEEAKRFYQEAVDAA